MQGKEFYKSLLKNFPFTPTIDQDKLMKEVSDFLTDPVSKKCFVLKGFAGTGKTSFIQSLVKTLPKAGYTFSLLAPTGRAAKVITEYTSCQAYTIHKGIYEIIPTNDENVEVKLSYNNIKNKIFIVDEASMIASGDDKGLFQGRNLLEDLVSHVYGSSRCCIIFIGDTAQLPPVGETLSQALDTGFLEHHFGMKIYSTELKEVVRQEKDSGILMNATALRILIGKMANEPVLKSAGYDDVSRIPGTEMQEYLQEFYSGRNNDKALIVCRSNKQANRYNAFIRNRLLGYEDSLVSGDRLMVVKNNYFWLQKDSSTGFIANGDTLKIKRVIGIEKKFGFTFADAIVTLLDYPGDGDLEVKLLLDTLMSESPSLSSENQKKLFMEVFKSFGKKGKAETRARKTYSDPYFNALQVKFSYAVTCHKAQGGQWSNVFIDSGFMSEGMYDTSFLRWLYTAVTRATDKVMFVNFEDRFFRI